MRPLWALIVAAALRLSACPPSQADDVDDYIKTVMRREHLPGLSLAVVKDGKLVKARGYGLANVELNVRARPLRCGLASRQAATPFWPRS